ncbi:hypothetical protein [Arcanobacterium hippocoleae]|uniref:hypothetical protein n=1 Tax=Arcanobacterium hippocoleae TaxID=149017 RepID=UPI0033408384
MDSRAEQWAFVKANLNIRRRGDFCQRRERLRGEGAIVDVAELDLGELKFMASWV